MERWSFLCQLWHHWSTDRGIMALFLCWTFFFYYCQLAQLTFHFSFRPSICLPAPVNHALLQQYSTPGLPARVTYTRQQLLSLKLSLSEPALQVCNRLRCLSIHDHDACSSEKKKNGRIEAGVAGSRDVGLFQSSFLHPIAAFTLLALLIIPHRPFPVPHDDTVSLMQPSTPTI